MPRLVDEAVAAGVRRLVLLSAPAADQHGHPLFAEVAASALTDDRHSGQTYELTGPRALSFGEATALIGEAVGRTVRHFDIDPDVYVQHQIARGVPPDAARLLAGVLVTIRDGGGAGLADGVERALGHPARSFEDYVTEAAATGCWN